MFSGMKMEKFIESEHSGIFPIELVTKNVVPQSLGIHFMHIILICYGLILICARIRRFILFLRILLRLWRSKDFPILEVLKSDSSKGSSVLTQESTPTFLSIPLLDLE